MHRLRGDVAMALEDLNTALRLCGGRGKVAVQAFCQRGLLYRLQDKPEEAKQDFTAAAARGNTFAQQQVREQLGDERVCGCGTFLFKTKCVCLCLCFVCLFVAGADESLCCSVWTNAV